MATVSCTQLVKADRQLTWDVFTDLAKAPERIEGIKELTILTDGPVGSGTRFRETRVMFGREATEEMEITVFEPPSRQVVEARSHGSHYVSEFIFEPYGDHTRVTLDFSMRPISLLAKAMSVMSQLMLKSVKTAMESDMSDLAKAAEGIDQRTGKQ